MKLKNIKSLINLKSIAGTLILAVTALCIIYGVNAQKQIADNVVRLHIVANSDSNEDQALKLEVRDAILESIKEKYPSGATKDEAAQYLKSNLSEIKKIAVGVLRGNDSEEFVDVKYGVFSFPTKDYENVALPAGKYEAVRVELGDAQGKNWWCVMFPPLCVSDASSIRMDEEAMSQLKQDIGWDNYSLITDITNRSNVKVKIKFRIVEMVQNSRIKLSDMLGQVF